MLALPGSLLWLFLLVYFSCGQILDKTSLDTSSNEGLGKLDKEVNHTVRSNEEEKENKTAELGEDESNRSSFSDDGEVNLIVNKTSKTAAQFLLENAQKVNGTTSSVSPGKNNRRRVPSRTTVGSNTTEILMMSEERRNSYLSIAERRKYYNRTRVQAKKSQANNADTENQETASNLGISSTETSQVDDVGTVKKPVTKDSSKKVTIDKNQASNQRLVVNFASNETQVKPQSVRQSVIQSQYQFGQKLNSRKPVSRARNMQDEKSKRKKEKSRAESAPENSTNRLIKNYPTQSTKLIKVDKNLWPTTTIPRPDADDDNFVAHSLANRTAVEKLNDYNTSNDTPIKACCNETEAALDRLNTEAETTNQTTVPEDSHFNPLPLNNLNVAVEQISVKNISANEEKNSRVIQDVYNQEILKLNKSASNTATGKGSFVENSVKNFSNYALITSDINNSESRSAADVASDTSGISTTAASSKTLLNTASKKNLTARNGKFSNAEVMRSSVLKSNPKEEARGSNDTVTAIVKATPHEFSNLTSGFKYIQSEKNMSKYAAQVEGKVKSLDGSLTPAGAENWNKMEKTDEYPLTIELNENNKRVLSEMFQTLAIPNQKKAAGAGETLTSQTDELLDISKNGSSTNNVSVKSPVETTTHASKFQSLPTVTPKTTPNETIISVVTINANVTIAPTTEDPQVLPPDMNEEEDYNAQGTRYNTKFYVSPKLNGTQVIKVVEEDDENGDDVDVQSRSAGIAIYVLAASGLIPLLVALIFGAKFMMHRNQREYECESDAKSDISANESQMKDGKKKKGSTNLKKSPSNVTTITLVTTTRLPRVQHWENSDKQGNRNWEFPRSKLKLKTILGQGNFGQVWKAETEDLPGHEGVTRLVAVKTVKEGATEKEHTEFIKELEIMQQIGSHPNIVALLGCCTDQEPFYLIMEYVKFGKLLTYLREHRINENYYNFSNNSDALTSRDLTVFAYCVARGMEYLASRGIIHRDLAARNVLVDHNKICKIADFGMSRSVRDFENGQVYEERQQKGALPIRWMAPESLVYSVFTYKSDVWSFGIVMWEIVTLGSTPYPNMGAREVMRKVRDGYRLERPSHCKLEFYRLISYCWAHDPNKRPDFSELRHELGNLLDNPTKDGSYVDLDRFAIDNNFHIPNKNNDFGLLEKNDFQTLRNLGDWVNKDWPEDKKKIRMKKGKNNGKGTVTLTGQGSFTVNSRILEKEFKII